MNIPSPLRKTIISLLLLAAGLAVFVLGSPYYSIFPTNKNFTYYSALTIFFLLVAFILLRRGNTKTIWLAVYAFFIASFATWFLSRGWFNIQISASDPVSLIAVDKLSQFLHVVPAILVLTLLSGENLKSIFLQKGNLKLGLWFGLVSFAIWAVMSFFIAQTSTDFFWRIKSGIGWVLLFVFSNSLMEELWFRGIFLKRFIPLVGAVPAILITAVWFGASHYSATYTFPGGPMVYGLVVFTLGLIGAYMMIKSDSLIGPVLFHAGYDLMIIVPILQSV